jgi:hypothetical protein
MCVGGCAQRAGAGRGGSGECACGPASCRHKALLIVGMQLTLCAAHPTRTIAVRGAAGPAQHCRLIHHPAQTIVREADGDVWCSVGCTDSLVWLQPQHDKPSCPELESATAAFCCWCCNLKIHTLYWVLLLLRVCRSLLQARWRPPWAQSCPPIGSAGTWATVAQASQAHR